MVKLYTSRSKTMRQFLNWALLLLIGTASIKSQAQTTISCTGTSVSYWSATTGAIVFGIRNTNAGGIIITDMSNHMPASNTNTFSLWYHPTVTTGIPADITTANGWVLAATGVSVTSTAAGVVPVLSGINLTVPGNTTYRLALVGSVACPYYTTSGTGANSFTGGGVEVLTQSNATSPTYVGYFPGPLTTTPRGFNGTITFNSAVSTPPNCLTNPVAPTNNSTTVCSGTTTLRWNKATGATGYDVYFNAGAAPATTIVSPNQADTFYNVTTATGPYSWKVVPKNSVGAATNCNNWNFTTVPGIIAAVSVTVAPNDTLCAGETATFTATPVNGGNSPSYQWKKNNVNVGSNSAVYVDAGLATNDYIRVVLTSNSAGCLSTPTVSSDSLRMTIMASPSATISASGPVVFCNGGSVRLNGPSNGLTYQWVHNNVPITGATSGTYTASITGYYKLKITTSAFCPSVSDSILITANPLPFPQVNRNGNVLSTASTYTSYQWYFNGQVIPGATANTHTISRDGRYKVVVDDVNGCGGSSIDLPVNSLSISAVAGSDISIYPNPASKLININSPVPVNITLSSVDGKVVLQQDNTRNIDISTLAGGVYTLQIFNKEHRLLKVEKVVKYSN